MRHLTQEIISSLNLIPLPDEPYVYEWPDLSTEDRKAYLKEDRPGRLELLYRSKTHWASITFPVELLDNVDLIKKISDRNWDNFKRNS